MGSEAADDLCASIMVAKSLLRKRLCTHELPPEIHGFEFETRQLQDLVSRTVLLGESNSILVVGPRGCGKSMLLTSILNKMSNAAQSKNNFVEVHLNGLLQKDDRISLQEITRQLQLENVVGDKVFGSFAENLQFLLDALKSGGAQSKSVVFVLDEFDLFAQHHNQTLLYNLFDVAQSAQAPLCVIGLTTRLDVLELLEKRVKSRFSHRQIHLCPKFSMDDYVAIFRMYLQLPDSIDADADFISRWNSRVESLCREPAIISLLKQQYDIDVNVRSLKSFMLLPVSRVNHDQPLLEPSDFVTSFKLLHATDSRAAMLNGLSILELCLIIAMKHLVEIHGDEQFNFQMVYNEYYKFCRRRSSVQLFDKVVVNKAFEHLCALELVRPVTVGGGHSQRLPADYRMMTLHIDPSEIMDALQRYPSCPTDVKQWAASSLTPAV